MIPSYDGKVETVEDAIKIVLVSFLHIKSMLSLKLGPLRKYWQISE